MNPSESFVAETNRNMPIFAYVVPASSDRFFAGILTGAAATLVGFLLGLFLF